MAIFLGFVLLATQTLTHLYATSIVTSAAFETARHLAAEDGGGCAGARPRATSLLGRHADTAQVACRDDGDRLAVRIVAQSPARLFTRIDPIDRAATVRIEQRR